MHDFALDTAAQEVLLAQQRLIDQRDLGSRLPVGNDKPDTFKPLNRLPYRRLAYPERLSQVLPRQPSARFQCKCYNLRAQLFIDLRGSRNMGRAQCRFRP